MVNYSLSTKPAKEIWDAALGELQIQVSRANYRTWLEKTIGLRNQNGQFVIGVPNTFVAEYLERNQSSLIEKTLINLTGQEVRIAFQVHDRQCDSGSPRSSPLTTPLFNPNYTFSSFVTGNCNRLAHAAALGVAENPGHAFNPLFIWGVPGVGKTHLLQAIGRVGVEKQMRVLYVSAEQFTNEFVRSVRERTTETFRNKYRQTDMLLMDDIPFISGKEQTEESFFHTFDELQNKSCQIAITSDRPPKAMPQLDAKLRSRLEGGLVTEIQPLDLETRLAILRAKAEQKRIDIAPDVLELIAQRLRLNVRELEGSLNRIIAYASLLKVMVTPEVVAQALGSIDNGSAESQVTPRLVIGTVAQSFQLDLSDIIGRKRDQKTAFARNIAIYLLKQSTNCSLSEIGKELGGRNPSTITRSYDKISAEIDGTPSLKHRIHGIKQQLQPQRISEH